MNKLFPFIFLIFLSIACQQGPVSSSNSYAWKPYSKKAIADSVAHKKPVVIDFTAAWCPNCHELDRTVFSLPQIQTKLSQVTALRMDVTNQDDPAVQKIIQEYDIEGVPTVIFLDSKGKEIKDSRVMGLVSPEEFNQALAVLNLFK